MKTRELVFQYPDGSYPGLYRVAVIENGLGSVDWSPATIDMSGNMDLPGNLDISGTATVGSTIYALSDVVVGGNLDVSGTLTVSSIETCALTAAQGRFTVDCSYGYVDIQPNTGLPPGGTAGSYNDSRINMYCGDGVTAQRSILRLFAQNRYDTAVTEGRLAFIDPSNAYITPALQFDASAEQLKLLAFDDLGNESVAMAVDLSGHVGVATTAPQYELDVSGTINSCGLLVSQQHFAVDCSYGYLSMRANLGLPPGVTAGSYNDSRINMYCSPGDANIFRIISQKRWDSQITEARMILTDTSGNILSPIIQFDASHNQIRILADETPTTNVALSIDGLGNLGVNTEAPLTTLDVNGTFRIDRNPPLTSTDPGVTGQIAWDESYLYVCVAGSSWARVGIAGW